VITQPVKGFFRYSGFPREENSSPLLPKEQLAPLAIETAVTAADKVLSIKLLNLSFKIQESPEA
jgi:hypothetical protein